MSGIFRFLPCRERKKALIDQHLNMKFWVMLIVVSYYLKIQTEETESCNLQLLFSSSIIEEDKTL